MFVVFGMNDEGAGDRRRGGSEKGVFAGGRKG